MAMIRTLAIISLLALSASAVAASNAVDRLSRFLEEVHTLKAHFTQTVTQAALPGATRSSGTVLIKRPNRFRWNYVEPNRQVIVSDGENIWMYDVALAQVTVKPLNAALASSPAMLLSGQGSIREAFNVVAQSASNGLQWVTLKPTADNAAFSKIRIGLGERSIQVMELTGANLGQVTRIEFSNVQRNPAIANEAFQFTPPPGADVIHAIR